MKYFRVMSSGNLNSIKYVLRMAVRPRSIKVCIENGSASALISTDLLDMD